MRQRTWQGGGLARRPNSPPPTGDTSKSCPPLLRFIGRRQSLSAHAVAKSRTNESACARYGLLPNQMPGRIGPTWKRAKSMDPLFQELRINMAATPVPTGVDGRWRRRMATLGPHSCLPSPLVSGTPFCNSICRSGFFHRDLLTSRH
jgi:hypothetical protein